MLNIGPVRINLLQGYAVPSTDIANGPGIVNRIEVARLEYISLNKGVTHGPSPDKSTSWTLEEPQSSGLPGVKLWFPV